MNIQRSGINTQYDSEGRMDLDSEVKVMQKNVVLA